MKYFYYGGSVVEKHINIEEETDLELLTKLNYKNDGAGDLRIVFKYSKKNNETQIMIGKYSKRKKFELKVKGKKIINQLEKEKPYSYIELETLDILIKYVLNPNEKLKQKLE